MQPNLTPIPRRVFPSVAAGTLRTTWRLGLFLLVASQAGGVTQAHAATRARPNVLFVAIDDLRNDLGVLGAPEARTPSLDAFAATARVFANQYAQVPTCGASRCALLRGRYPSEPSQIGNNAILATHARWGDANLPQWFRTHGYQTLALGKITHYPGGLAGKNWAEKPEELPGAWDRSWIPDAPWKSPQAMMHGYASGQPRIPGKTPPWEAGDGPDTQYPDAWVAADAVATLRRLARSEQPWFFAVGLFKPHLPFAAPSRYFDLHAKDADPGPAVTARPVGPSSWHPSNEFRLNYAHHGKDPESDPEYARLIRRAYAAATSYVDAQAGRVFAALEELGLADNTIVVVWGDHGFLLGEHAVWGKHCLYDRALQSPLMIRTPHLLRAGEVSKAIVETVDVFPTLADLCGLPAPAGLDGRSLRVQLDDPSAPSTKPAVGYWTEGRRTVRTERWRLTDHPPGKSGDKAGVELFDYQTDPDEAHNIAADHPRIVAQLLAQLPPALPSDPREGKAP